ncbi:hypothetical protein WR25_02759 isoform C [Diploscapter pachys]|uniref:Thioredoxin domain-containing protein n=2 Tax=Diploscapter pachys TaxID=2018661 RepID=A0A2A2J2W1_9BILA|nr:hypothetical protein WR25_02759 isoform C [Diploscapter pachys]
MLFSSFLIEARQAATLYHLANVVLSIAFLIVRGIPQLCEMILVPEENGECTVTSREREILLFLAVIILVKGRKTTNWRHYVNNIFLFSKIANIFLFLRVDVIAGIVYLFLMIVVTVLVPEPAYSGPEKVTYFNNTELFDTLATDRRTTWVIQFYTTWSSECRHSSPVFSQLSEKFTLPNLKFGKLDVSRWAKEGERFRVNSHPSSRQLPTVCVFKDAKEVLRRPVVNENRRAVPFVFNEVGDLWFTLFIFKSFQEKYLLDLSSRIICSRR